jgi:hypothetical protein
LITEAIPPANLPPTDRHEDRREIARRLPHSLQGDCRLTGDYFRIVIRMDERHSALGGHSRARHFRFGVVFADQREPCPMPPHRFNFDLSSCPRHHQHGIDTQHPRRLCDPLRVIAYRCRDDSARFLFIIQEHNPVIGPA